MIPIKNMYFILCYAYETLDIKGLMNIESSKDDTLLLYIIKIFINQTYELINKGLIMAYVEKEDLLTKVSGKISVLNTIRKLQLKKGRAYCIYDEFSRDVIVNRIIKSTLLRVHNLIDNGRKERRQIENILDYLSDISIIEITRDLYSAIQINGLNRNYIILLDICKLINESLVPIGLGNEERFVDFIRDEKKMRMIFQKFVFNFYRLEQSEFCVRRENIEWDLKSDSQLAKKFIPVMQTDISLESRSRKIIIDTKYYKETLNERFGCKKIRSENLYQLSSYLYNVESKEPIDQNKKCEGILLYPTVDCDLNLEYNFRSHKLKIITLNLNKDWREIKKELLSILSIY
jgi:5-methylcytosine-specific restriction enzyme subunit McrC